MDLALTKQWITHWEGTRVQTYLDSKKIPTIGVGFNLKSPSARSAIASLGLNYDAVLSGTITLTLSQIDQLLTRTIQTAIAAARALVSNFDALPSDQQVVVIDLAFNLGRRGLSEFTDTLRSIEAQDWPNAAINLRQSAWFTQVGIKANERGGADVAVIGGSRTAASILGLPVVPSIAEEIEPVST